MPYKSEVIYLFYHIVLKLFFKIIQLFARNMRHCTVTFLLFLTFLRVVHSYISATQPWRWPTSSAAMGSAPSAFVVWLVVIAAVVVIGFITLVKNIKFTTSMAIRGTYKLDSDSIWNV